MIFLNNFNATAKSERQSKYEYEIGKKYEQVSAQAESLLGRVFGIAVRNTIEARLFYLIYIFEKSNKFEMGRGESGIFLFTLLHCKIVVDRFGVFHF